MDDYRRFTLNSDNPVHPNNLDGALFGQIIKGERILEIELDVPVKECISVILFTNGVTNTISYYPRKKFETFLIPSAYTGFALRFEIIGSSNIAFKDTVIKGKYCLRIPKVGEPKPDYVFKYTRLVEKSAWY